MMLTFLNLIAVSGILVGLIEGSEQAIRKVSLGDIVLSELDGENYILETESMIREIEAYPEVTNYSVRYKASATLEANYKERRNLQNERDVAAISVTGIDPIKESEMTGLDSLVIDGEYLDPNEEGYILMGVFSLRNMQSNLVMF